MTGSRSYDSSSIQALSPHQHLLKRISLTFGSESGDSGHPFSSQKSTAVREVVDNAVDEVSAGFGDRVRVTFFKDGSVQVEDSGRGIPVDSSLDANGRMVSGVFKALGIIQSGGKFGGSGFSAGLNGVGAASTNHLSRRMDVSVFRDGKCHRVSFQDGVPGFFDTEGDPDAGFTELGDYAHLEVSKDRRPKEERDLFLTGTTIRLWLRDEVFQSPYPVDVDDLVERLRSTAYLIPGIWVEVVNEHRQVKDPETGVVGPQREVFHFEDGLTDLASANLSSAPISDPVHVSCEGRYMERNVPVVKADGTVAHEDVERTVPVEAVMVWGDGFEGSVASFVNTIHTKLGGVHEDAFAKAVVAAFGEKLASVRGLMTRKDSLPIWEDYLEGLSLVLSVRVSEPSFTSQTKEQLGGTAVRKAIQEAATEALSAWVGQRANSEAVQTIGRKVVEAARARVRAKERRDAARTKSQISGLSLPSKLVDCELAGTDEASLYICEGNSALSSLKAARDGRVDAILPIRGKIIEASSNSMSKVLANSEVQDIIKTLGAGYGDDFDIDRMRYARVLIAVDADPDGNSIACLIYSLFWHLFRPVVEEGRLFKIETPLFSIATREGRNSRKVYARDDAERDERMRELDEAGVKYDVSRLKGLGEVEADILEETAIDPATRVLTQITLPDVSAAESALSLLFGKSQTDARKEWMTGERVDEEDLI